MAKVKVAINGFGRIGRITYRALLKKENVEVVAFNDLTDPKTLAHLFKYDSVHGKFDGTVDVDGDKLIINGNAIRVYSERNPADLPWGDLGVDIVVECTGIFRKREQMNWHIEAGAKKVLLSVPSAAANDVDKTIVLGVNDNLLTDDDKLVSNASCTTNCLSPIAKVLHDNFGIKSGLMNTIHSYTNDQIILDSPHSDLRRARSAAVSIIPTSTGAAKAIGLVIPELDGVLHGLAMRVPTPDGSVVDLTCELEKVPTVEEINAVMKAAAEGPMKGILEYCTDPIVSIDVVGNTHSSIYDVALTMVKGNIVKVVSWYDNEAGYSNRLADMVERMA
ncbi:MAG: type I glyceraldehyde-3-phosphate dehydrogenase [Bacteroidales bacterium]|nr:type I glyceraldehyde-3-phosphate dehydrogenase [Bacteroidales bacterium]